MEMKDIDLTKCNNCRAWVRYRYDRVYEDTGRIEKVTEEGGKVWLRFVADEDGELITMWEDGKICEHIMDFEIVPRDPETYMDWQVGDRVCDNEHRNASREVIFRSGELVVMKTDANTACSNYTCDELFGCGYRLVLTDIEQKIIEGKKKYEPQDGDICYVEATDGYCSIFIYKNGFHRTNYYTSLDTYKGCSTRLFTTGGHVVANSRITVLRPATEDEKQRLFDAMAKEGKRWNAEKKVVVDIPKPYEFKKGEPVLARNGSCEKWCICAYKRAEGTTNRVFVGESEAYYVEIVPYNEKTMHLLGTNEDYKEE